MKGYYYVKLDRISPNYNNDGTLDPKHRNAVRNGLYKFATEMSAISPCNHCESSQIHRQGSGGWHWQ